MKIILDCRNTGRGAYTAFAREHCAKVFDRSRTGNHWKEVVEAEPGDRLFVHDISNSGKHNCYVLVVQAGGDHRREVSAGWRKDFCPICERE